MGIWDLGGGPWQALTSFSPSRLQEAEKQNQGLQQELAALREELRARGPGGEWLSARLSGSGPPDQPQLPRGVAHSLAGLWRQEFVPDCRLLDYLLASTTEHLLYAMSPPPTKYYSHCPILLRWKLRLLGASGISVRARPGTPTPVTHALCLQTSPQTP